MKPPIRLRDDPQTAPELRADLERSASAASEYDVAAGLIGLQAAIGAPMPPVGSGGAASSGASVTGTAGAAAKVGGLSALGAGSIKLVLVGVVATGGAAAITTAWLDRPHTDIAPVAADERPVAGPNSSARAVQVPQPSPPQPAAPTPYLAPVPPAPTDDAAQVALRSEIAQLGRIKALVDEDPARAYELVRAGQREFAPGILRHEREALAVRALWNMGSRDAARREARRFLERYPQSPLRPRIEQLLTETR
jgi:hypothetical protein